MVKLKKKKFIINYFKKFTKKVSLINDFKKIKKDTELLIILSFYKIIPEKYLKISRHNLVVHESDLPKGKGHSPLYWQILQGKLKLFLHYSKHQKKWTPVNIILKRNFYLKIHCYMMK